MLNNKIYILSIIMIILTVLTGCGKENEPKVISGKYVAADGESYVVVDGYEKGKSDKFEEVIGYCNIQFFNVDLTSYEEFYLNNNTASYIAVNIEGSVSDDQIKEIQDMLKDRVDLKKQFEDNKARFFYYKDSYGDYGLGCEIDGSGFDQGYETYVNLLYLPEDKTIVINEMKYVLQE